MSDRTSIKEWFSVSELAAAGLPGLRSSEKSLDNYARNHWRGNPALARVVQGKTKPVWQYHISLLPQEAQWRLNADIVADTSWKEAQTRKNQLWARLQCPFEGAESRL